MTPAASATFKPIPHHEHIGAERCPWCDQPIPAEKLEEITDRILSRERQRQAETESKARQAMEALERSVAAKEAAARIAGQAAAEAVLQQKLADIEIARRAAEQRAADLAAQQEALVIARLAEQREAFEAAKTAEINAERVRAFEEKLKLEAKLQEMQRQIQNKTAEELGETAESDLFEDLRRQFPDDRISRIEKGAAGPDIIQDIVHNGRVCGRIIYDAKNRNAWRNDYVTKLRQDQIAFRADHAILSTLVFPAGAKELHMQDGIIITGPVRSPVVANLLRRHVVQTHTLRLSNEARSQKTEALYDFINSERCQQFFALIVKQADAMTDLDVKEKRAHDATWKRRDEIVRTLQSAHGQLSAEIERIVSAPGDSEL